MKLYQLLSIAPAIGAARAQEFIDPLNAAMAWCGADASPERQAHFVAQALHESSNFSRMVESLNYAADRLLVIWPKHFTPETAQMYGRTATHAANEAMIANTAYANRNGNGSIESGDGYRYRGRGIGQLTGRANYAACGAAIGLDLVGCPDQVAQPEAGCMAFAWFWKARGLNELADAGDVVRISHTINGGDLGLNEREALTRIALQTMEGQPA